MRRLISLSLWTAVGVVSAPALAQPTVTVDVHAKKAPTATVVVGGHHWPTAAPPPPREEKFDPRAGEVWVKGRWDWKDGKWEWMPGHPEHEHAGQHWREARWEDKNGHYELVEGGWDQGAPTATVVVGGHHWPTAAPPPPREEKLELKAGEVWVKGRWDWKDGKWEWMAGHPDRDHSGKRWREARWEDKHGHYELVEGDWEDGGTAATPPAPPPAAGDRDHHRREWKLDRPTVSSYWPTKGKAGTHIVIRGKNFPTDAMVMWGTTQIMGAKVKDDEIVFEVPAGAASGDIMVHAGHGRPLPVGAFEVTATYDAAAEAKRLEDERRKNAETAWANRQAALAKDQAAREAAVRHREEEMASSREQRREKRAAEIKAKWDRAFLADADVQAELTLHASRVAHLERMRDVAEIKSDAKLNVRIDMATALEGQRHETRMTALQEAFKRGGAK